MGILSTQSGDVMRLAVPMSADEVTHGPEFGQFPPPAVTVARPFNWLLWVSRRSIASIE
jgi:hypothetical protein